MAVIECWHDRTCCFYNTNCTREYKSVNGQKLYDKCMVCTPR